MTDIKARRRQSKNGSAAADQGVVMNGIANITPTDSNALAFSRTTTHIVYLGGASANYGFFPHGLNGAIA
jgi:hypothetical protein